MEGIEDESNMLRNMQESDTEKMTFFALNLEQKLLTSSRKTKILTSRDILDLMCQATDPRVIALLKMLLIPLGEFLKELAKDAQTSHAHLTKILPSLRKCIIERVVLYKDLPYRLREQLVTLVIARRIDHQLFEQCLLVLVSFVTDCHATSLIVTLIFNVLDDDPEMIILTHNVDGKKISRFTLFIISLLQNILNVEAYPYEKCNVFAEKVIAILRQKCKDVKFSILFKTFVNDLMTLSCDLSWPVTGIIIPHLCHRLVDDVAKSTDVRYTTLILNLLKDISLVIRLNDAKFREKELLFHTNFKPIEPSLREIIICVAASKRAVTVFGGDILKAYAAVWRSSDENAGHSVLPDLTEYDAQVAKYLIDFNKLQFFLFVNCFIEGCKHPTKSVKSTAFKCLSDILEHTPTLLRDRRVCSIITDSAPYLNAQGKVGLANILGMFIDLDPKELNEVKPIFKTLLADASKIVMRAAIKALAKIYSKHEDIDCELQDCVVSLYNSLEGADRAIIVTFFVRVWLNGKHLKSLYYQCSKEIHKKVIFNIFRQLQYEVNQEYQNYLAHQTSKLVNISITRLNDGDNLIRLGAANLIKNLAKTFPNLVEGQIPVLTNILFTTCNELQITVCKTLILLADKIKNYMTDFSKTIENNLPKLRLKFNPYTHVLIVKLLAAVGDNHQLKRLLILGMQHLNDVQNFNIRSALAKINESICFVILLSNYNENPTMANIIHNFLNDPKHSSTILIALSEVRNEFIPTKADTGFLQLLAQFLEDENNVSRLLDTLHYLKNLLKGYRNIIQNPELRTLGDSTTEYVSYTLQHCLKHITKCVLSRNAFIRKSAGNVIFHIDRSGLIIFPKLLPSIVAMTTEINVAIKKFAMMTLVHRRQWGIASCVECLYSCYRLALCLSPNCMIRGFHSESFQPVCHAWFSIILNSRQNLKSLITKIFIEYNKTENLEFATFLLDNVIYLSYKHLEDVEFLVDLIKKSIVTSEGSVDKLCNLKKAQSYIHYVYNLPRRLMIRSASNRGELVCRKSPEYDYLPHLETNRYAIKNEEFEGDEFNISLAELRRRMLEETIGENSNEEESRNEEATLETEDDGTILESPNPSSTEKRKVSVVLQRLPENVISKLCAETTIKVYEKSDNDGKPREVSEDSDDIAKQVTEENEIVEYTKEKSKKRRRERSCGEADEQAKEENPNGTSKKPQSAVKRVRWSI